MINQFTKNIFSKNDVLESTIKYFNGDKLAADVWMNKYCLKEAINDDIIYYEKDPSDMHRRLASEFSRIENKYDNPLSEKEIFDSLDKFKYIVPQGSPMSGIGNNKQIVSLSNCYVVGYDSDSYGSICLTDEEQIQLMKRRGGVGHDLSHIRPKGSLVKNSAMTSTGIVPFMERYSNSTNEVAQNGRRGALMLSISVNHLDVEDFIDAKMKDGKVTGANISVKIDDEFMRAVENKTEYIQKYPIYSDSPKNLKKINATELWKKIIHNAWQSAEPGLLFWDTIIRESVPDCYSEHGFKTISTNPCAEIPLCKNDSCRLLALNLYSYVVNPFEENAYFDFDLFKKIYLDWSKING
jgi:ribonucleoside-diphosphate reductase alpha chain